MENNTVNYNAGNGRNPYITPVNITLVIINVVMFFVSDIMARFGGTDYIVIAGALFPPAVLTGQWYRLITCTFLHSDIHHLFNNMLLLVCLGSYLERSLGKVKYLIFYFLSGLVSSMISAGWMIAAGDIAWSLGASGVVFGIIGALLWMLIRNRGRFEGLSITRFVVMIVLSLYFGFTSVGVDNAAHVGGLLAGFVLGIILYRKKTCPY